MPPETAFLASVIQGGQMEWPSGGGVCSDVEFLAAADRHGVMPLVADVLIRAGEAQWPHSLSSAIRRRAAEAIVLTTLRARELRLVLRDLARAGVPALLIKGTALAHTLYREPHLRPSFDTDLFVKAEDLTAACSVFESLAYRRSRQIGGDLLAQQLDYEKRDSHGIWHIFDIHWKIANPLAFAALPTFVELSNEAAPVPSLGAHAWRPSDVYSLLIACVHRIAHHARESKLIWTYDIHLLAERLDAADLRRFVQIAKARRVSGVCASALAEAALSFRTRVPAGLVEELAGHSLSVREPSRLFIEGQTQLGVFLSDLKLLGRWKDRLRLIRQHAFPGATYMFQAYGVQSRALLPALYTHRAVAGIWKWTRK